VSGELELRGLTKGFGDHVVVDHLDLRVPDGEFYALLGPSGCGKTTTLRMVAGLEQPDSGQVILDGRDITNDRAYKRPINTVFQNYALFPHLTVFENVAFGLRERRVKEIDRRVQEALELVQLAGFGNRKPTQLSGGQQQRVALARAIVNEPDVLLLDEPLGALDLKLRNQMQIELKRIQGELGMTFVHVTHDQDEAMTMADTIAVMNEGRILQSGDPVELYENPNSTFVANFLGVSNLLEGRVVGGEGEMIEVEVRGARLTVPRERSAVDSGPILVGVRPEKLDLRPPGADGNGQNRLRGRVVNLSFTGIGTRYQIDTEAGEEIVAFVQNLNSRTQPRIDETVELTWSPEHTFALDGRQDREAGAAEVVELE
jgi:spermidine/putrescine transport system ATP-binding protein